MGGTLLVGHAHRSPAQTDCRSAGREQQPFLGLLVRGPVVGVKTTLSHTNVTLAPTPVGRVPHVNITALSAWGCRTTFGTFVPTYESAMAALMERVFYHRTEEGFARPTVPSREVVFDTLRGVLDALSRSCVLNAPVSILSYAGIYYRGLKRQLYEKASQVVYRRGFQRRDAMLKSFVKVEKIEIKPKRLVPRLIQPRSPEFNVLVGRFIKHLEHPTYLQLGKLWGGPTVMKGLNCFQQARAMRSAWESFDHPVAIMLDAVRFDQHVSKPMLEWEHTVYLMSYRGRWRVQLQELLRHQLVNRGRIRTERGTIKYTVEGCRMSGDMNTALGNCLVMCACCKAMVDSLGVRARLFNNGDDCCLLVEKRDLERVSAAVKPFFLKLGFIIDVEGITGTFERISFCQTQPVYDGHSWRMVRDPRKVLSKDTTLLRKWSSKEWYAYWTALGKCGLALTWGLPVFQEFYSAMVRFGDGRAISAALSAHVSGALSQSGMYQLAHGLESRVRPVTDAARTSFMIAFGITPAVQLEFEDVYRRAPPASDALFEVQRLSLNL